MLSFLIRVLLDGRKTDLFMLENSKDFNLKILCGKLVAECIVILNRVLDGEIVFSSFEFFYDLKMLRNDLSFFPSNGKVLVLNLPRKIVCESEIKRINFHPKLEKLFS